MNPLPTVLKKTAITTGIHVILWGAIGGVLGRVSPRLVEGILNRPYYYKSLVLPGICIGAAMGLLIGLTVSGGPILMRSRWMHGRAIKVAAPIIALLLCWVLTATWGVATLDFMRQNMLKPGPHYYNRQCELKAIAPFVIKLVASARTAGEGYQYTSGYYLWFFGYWRQLSYG